MSVSGFGEGHVQAKISGFNKSISRHKEKQNQFPEFKAQQEKVDNVAKKTFSTQTDSSSSVRRSLSVATGSPVGGDSQIEESEEILDFGATQGESSGIEEKAQAKVEQSTVSDMGSVPEDVSAMAEDTQDVAFNALEKFVAIFSKSKAAKMRDKRVDGMTAKVQKHLESGDGPKALRAAVKLAKASPERLEEALSQVSTESRSINLGAMSEKKTIAFSQKLTTTLKQLPPNDYPQSNKLLSTTLGKAILQPRSTEDSEDKAITDAQHFIKFKGIDKPSKCGGDLWRTMPRIKIFKEGQKQPLMDGSKISSDKDVKDSQYSEKMRETLNLFYKHASGSEDEFIPVEEQGKSQKEAQDLGESLNGRLDGKELSGKQKQTMQKLFGLGAQELYTQPANWTIRDNFRVRTGQAKLEITEFSQSPVVAEFMQPLEYGRSISITLLDDGGVEYSVSQPITFKDRESFEPIGTCRMVSTFTFDSEMECTSMTQEVKAPEIDKKVLIEKQKDWSPGGVFQNKTLFTEMKAFAGTNQGGQNAEYFEFMEEMYPLLEETDPQKFQDGFKELYETFIKPDEGFSFEGQVKLNVDAKMVQEAEDHLEEGGMQEAKNYLKKVVDEGFTDQGMWKSITDTFKKEYS